MYMEPIVATATVSPLKRRLVGVPVLAVSALVMVPWLGLNLAWSGLALGARGIVKLPRTLTTMVDYAGAVALGE
jgi:hypothetical protein